MPGAPLSLTSAPGRCPTRLLSPCPKARAHFGACAGPSRPSASATGPRPPPAPRAPGTHHGRGARGPTPQRRQQAPRSPRGPESRRHGRRPRAARRTACPPAAHWPGAGSRTAPSCEPRRPAQPGPAAQARPRPGPGRPPAASMALCWQRADAARQAPGLSGPARAVGASPGPAPRFQPARRW